MFQNWKEKKYPMEDNSATTFHFHCSCVWFKIFLILILFACWRISLVCCDGVDSTMQAQAGVRNGYRCRPRHITGRMLALPPGVRALGQVAQVAQMSSPPTSSPPPTHTHTHTQKHPLDPPPTPIPTVNKKQQQ